MCVDDSLLLLCHYHFLGCFPDLILVVMVVLHGVCGFIFTHVSVLLLLYV